MSQVAAVYRVPVPESQIAGFLMSHSLGHLPLEFPIMPHIMPWNRASCLGCPQCGNPCDPDRRPSYQIWISDPQLRWDHPEVCNYGRNYQLVTAGP